VTGRTTVALVSLALLTLGGLSWLAAGAFASLAAARGQALADQVATPAAQ
jgi:hypothetical protein